MPWVSALILSNEGQGFGDFLAATGSIELF